MIGNPKWFKRRKYTGWGLTPSTWQGYLYLIGMIIPILVIKLLSSQFHLSLKTELAITFIYIALISIDILLIISKLAKDEREVFHEALAERNVTWFIITILCFGIVYQALSSVFNGILIIDPFIIIALLGGTIVKAISNWYLLDK